MGGHAFFSEPKRGGGHVFFQSLILNIFLKKICNIRNQSASCTTEPLFVSLSNTDLQRFCLIHKPHSSILTDLFINKILYTISRSMYLLREKSAGKEKSHEQLKDVAGMRKEMESLQLRANNSLTLLKDMFKGQTVHKGKAQ